MTDLERDVNGLAEAGIEYKLEMPVDFEGSTITTAFATHYYDENGNYLGKNSLPWVKAAMRVCGGR